MSDVQPEIETTGGPGDPKVEIVGDPRHPKIEIIGGAGPYEAAAIMAAIDAALTELLAT